MKQNLPYNENIKDVMFQAVCSNNCSSNPTTKFKELPGKLSKSPLFPSAKDRSDPLQEVLILLMDLHKRVIRIEEKLSYLEYNLVLK